MLASHFQCLAIAVPHGGVKTWVLILAPILTAVLICSASLGRLGRLKSSIDTAWFWCTLLRYHGVSIDASDQ
jgi:hypothetical protein